MDKSPVIFFANIVCCLWNVYNFFTFTPPIYAKHGLFGAAGYTVLVSAMFLICAFVAWKHRPPYEN